MRGNGCFRLSPPPIPQALGLSGDKGPSVSNTSGIILQPTLIPGKTVSPQRVAVNLQTQLNSTRNSAPGSSPSSPALSPPLLQSPRAPATVSTPHPPHSPSLGPVASTQDSVQSALHTDASGVFSTHRSDHSKHTRVHTPAQNPLMPSQGTKYQFLTWTQDRPPPPLTPYPMAAPLSPCPCVPAHHAIPLPEHTCPSCKLSRHPGLLPWATSHLIVPPVCVNLGWGQVP